MAHGAVVVTGASTGIGNACALKLDAAGFRVFAGVRKDADAEALRKAASERLTPIHLDVSDATQIGQAAEQVGAAVGEAGLAGLVNNAGIGVGGPIEFVPIDDLRRQFEVNVIGLVAVTQAFLGLLRQGRGRIVNMGSASGRIAMAFVGPYAASKHALEALSDSLRMELRPWGIHVALIEPGVIATPIWQKSREAGDALRKAIPEQGLQLYRQVIERFEEEIGKVERAGHPPEVVAEVVHHALTAARPRTRYLCGKAARLQVALTHLPDRLRDALLLRAMGIR